MITRIEYLQKKEEFWIGKKVRTLREMRNGWVIIPVGTILKIRRKYQGFTLEAVEICPHCKIGNRLDISRVSPEALELVEEVYKDDK